MRCDDILYDMKSLFREIHRNYFKEDVLSPTQIEIIGFIIKNEDKVFQRDLEDVLNLTRASVSEVLKTMEKNGLIKRVICRNDMRKKEIILTDKAVDIFKKGEKIVKEVNGLIVRDISDEDMNTFYKVIDKMKENLKEVNR